MGVDKYPPLWYNGYRKEDGTMSAKEYYKYKKMKYENILKECGK